jgi:hypothetical protein
MLKQIAPVNVLLVCALTIWCCIHRIIVSDSGISQWKLGGFGMFSSINHPQTRFILLHNSKGYCNLSDLVVSKLIYEFSEYEKNQLVNSLKSYIKSEGANRTSISTCFAPNSVTELYFGFVNFDLNSKVFSRKILKTWVVEK